MSENEIKSIISEIVVNHQFLRYNLDLRNHTFSDDDRLSEDFNADSLDAMEIIMESEDAFSAHIPDFKIRNICTFGDLCKLFTKSGA